MLAERDREYHRKRATMELDLAYRAEKQAAAEAHLRLSALHLARLRNEITERQPH
jgi:hypothetical protein